MATNIRGVLALQVPTTPEARQEEVSAVLERLEGARSAPSTPLESPTPHPASWDGYEHLFAATSRDRLLGTPVSLTFAQYMRYGRDDMLLQRQLSTVGVFFGAPCLPRSHSVFLDDSTSLILPPPMLPELGPAEYTPRRLRIARTASECFDSASSAGTIDLFSPPLPGANPSPFDPTYQPYALQDTNTELEALGLTRTPSAICYEEMLQYVSATDSPSPARGSSPPSVRRSHTTPLLTANPIPAASCRPLRPLQSCSNALARLADAYGSDSESDSDVPRRPPMKHSKTWPPAPLHIAREQEQVPALPSLPTPPPTSTFDAPLPVMQAPVSPSPFRQPSGETLQPLADRIQMSQVLQPQAGQAESDDCHRFPVEVMPLALGVAGADELATPPQSPADGMIPRVLPKLPEDAKDEDSLMKDSHSDRRASPETSPEIPLLKIMRASSRIMPVGGRRLSYDPDSRMALDNRLKRPLSPATFDSKNETPAKRRQVYTPVFFSDQGQRFFQQERQYVSAPNATARPTELHIPPLPYPPAFSAPALYHGAYRRLSMPMFPSLMPFPLPTQTAYGTEWSVHMKKEAVALIDPFSHDETAHLTPATHSSSLTPLTRSESVDSFGSGSETDDSAGPDPLLLKANDRKPSTNMTTRASKPKSETVGKKPKAKPGKKSKPKPKFEKKFWTDAEDDICMDYWDGIGPIKLHRMAECGKKLVEAGFPWRSEKAIRWRCFNPLRPRFEAKAKAIQAAARPRTTSRVSLDRNVRLVQSARRYEAESD